MVEPQSGFTERLNAGTILTIFNYFQTVRARALLLHKIFLLYTDDIEWSCVYEISVLTHKFQIHMFHNLFYFLNGLSVLSETVDILQKKRDVTE